MRASTLDGFSGESVQPPNASAANLQRRYERERDNRDHYADAFGHDSPFRKRFSCMASNIT
jgi:hypothetical protein